MKNPTPGQTILQSTNYIILEIEKLLHKHLDNEWVANEWRKKENGEDNIHPFISMAYTAHQQINEFKRTNTLGMTSETFELAELAIKINELKVHNVKGLQSKLSNLTSFDYGLYLTARYEIQIAGMFLHRDYRVNFIKEGNGKTPDILIATPKGYCEVECKHKERNLDQIDYIRSIYNNTQKARKQFSKTCPGIICIDIDKGHFDEFQKERERLNTEISRALRNSSSISAVFLTSKVSVEENDDFVYRHRVTGVSNAKARNPLPDWIAQNIVSN